MLPCRAQNHRPAPQRPRAIPSSLFSLSSSFVPLLPSSKSCLSLLAFPHATSLSASRHLNGAPQCAHHQLDSLLCEDEPLVVLKTPRTFSKDGGPCRGMWSQKANHVLRWTRFFHGSLLENRGKSWTRPRGPNILRDPSSSRYRLFLDRGPRSSLKYDKEQSQFLDSAAIAFPAGTTTCWV